MDMLDTRSQLLNMCVLYIDRFTFIHIGWNSKHWTRLQLTDTHCVYLNGECKSRESWINIDINVLFNVKLWLIYYSVSYKYSSYFLRYFAVRSFVLMYGAFVLFVWYGLAVGFDCVFRSQHTYTYSHTQWLMIKSRYTFLCCFFFHLALFLYLLSSNFCFYQWIHWI